MDSIIYCIKKIIIRISGFLILMILSSCVTSNLQTASVKGPDSKSTVHLAKDDTKTRLIISPFFINNIEKMTSINTDTHTKVNREGIYDLEPVSGDTNMFIERKGVNQYPFSGKNLFWNRPSYIGGCDLEFTTEGKTVTLGMTYGQINGEHFFSGLFGGSLFFPKTFRLGFDLYYQSIAYNAVVVTSESFYFNNTRNVEYIGWNGRRDYINYDLYLSWRSYLQNYIYFDVFAEGAFGGQTLVDVHSKDINNNNLNGKLDYTDHFYSITLGSFKNITDNSRIIAGYKMTFHPDEYSNLDVRSDSFFLQYEYDFVLSK